MSLALAACSPPSPAHLGSGSTGPTATSGVEGGAPAAPLFEGGLSESGPPEAGSTQLAGDGGAAASTFQPEPASVYVAKVKNILVGLPPTDAEIQAVEGDPTQLKTLIDGWMALPEYQQKMLVFFELAFQQTQIAISDFADQTYPRQAVLNASVQQALAQNARESFARTVLELNAQGRPLTDAITTTRYMMTPALMEFYGFLDAWQVDDAGNVTDRFRLANPKLTITVEASQGPIPLAQTLDPTSPSYMHWYDPDVANDASSGPGCGQDPIVYAAGADTIHYLLSGSLLGRKSPTGGVCQQMGGSAAAPQFAPSDFTTWTMVNIRPPAAGEAPTPFYDLARLRSATELVLTLPRVGFLTPAFFANWQTNTSNQMRVTTNQALIVATGAAVDGTDLTLSPSTPGLDAAHASASQCIYCHQTLDPTRSILAATYSWSYHAQRDPAYSGQDGLFAFQGDVQSVSSIADFASVLAQHPLFARAWAQKLCYYANSAACEPTDPEFKRVVGVFASSGYAWSALVRELLSSSLVTHAATTQTAADTGEVIAVSRRDHFCAALNARLGLTDVCGLDVLTKAAARTAIPEIVSGLPSDGYGRGGVAPILPNAPTLFFRAATENICEAVAALVIDNPKPESPAARQWSSAQPDAAIADFVQVVMALASSDARSAPAQALLKAHFSAAVQSGATASNALKSTFVAACLAPSSVSIGL